MKRQAIPMKVKNLYKMYQRDNLTFENEIQRVFEQWKDDQKSLLIHSILDDYIIPPIYLIKEDKGSKDSRGRRQPHELKGRRRFAQKIQDPHHGSFLGRRSA